MRARECMFLVIGLTVFFLSSGSTHGISTNESEAPNIDTYDLGTLKPTNSVLKVKVRDRAPDITLLSVVSKKNVSLSQYIGKKECSPLLRACGMDVRVFSPVAKL
jgi:hypothetical protein